MLKNAELGWLPREPSEGRRNTNGSLCGARAPRGARNMTQQFFSESLILAQNERWQRGLGMQVERDPEGSNIGR